MSTNETRYAPLTLTFDKKIYSKSALMMTAFLMTDKLYLHLRQNEDYWIVDCIRKDLSSASEYEFSNELIHQQCHLDLLIQNADIRKILLARALASTVLENGVGQTAAEDEYSSVQVEKGIDDDFSEDEILRSWY